MVLVNYKGREDSDEIDLALIGKGVTHDSGGLNIKTVNMDFMFGDKGGSCAVIGALVGILDLQPKKNVIFCCGFADNALDAKSYKPSDILTSYKGSTVEIGNTDAEGRLVMADCMSYVQRHYKVKKMFDLATLTGAIFLALGKETAGAFGNKKSTIQSVIKAG